MANLKFRSVLIVTYGRSGSTLLQGLLNSIDGVLVRGENNNFAYSLFEAHQRLLRAKTALYNRSADDPTHSWYGAPSIDINRFKADCGKIIERVIIGDHHQSDVKCFGFKEIRYVDIQSNFRPYMNFLFSALPDLGVVFNTRDLDAVVKSGWWAKEDPQLIKEKLRRLENQFAAYALDNPDTTFSITYEEVLENGRKVERLFDFLGADYNSSAVGNVLALEHSVPSVRRRD